MKIDPEHPCLAGHFSGNPIVPAALLVTIAIEHLEQTANRKVIRIPSAKFQKPLRPGVDFDLEIEFNDAAAAKLTMTTEDYVVFNLTAQFEE